MPDNSVPDPSRLSAASAEARQRGDYNAALDTDLACLEALRSRNTVEGEDSSSLIADCHYALGKDYRLMGRLDEALASHRRALAIRRELGQAGKAADSLTSIGIALWTLGRYGEALESYLEAYNVYLDLGDRAGMANCRNNMGLIRWNLGEREAALDFYREALPLYESLSDKVGLPSCLNNIGIILQELGRLPEADEAYEKSLAAYRAAGDKWGEANTLNNLGIVQEERGELERAIETYRTSLEAQRVLGSGRSESMALGNLGQVEFKLGRVGEARAHILEAMRLARELGCRDLVRDDLERLAALAAECSEWKEAYEFELEFHALQTELSGEESRKHALELEKRFETERARKDAEIERLRNVELKSAIEARDRMFSVIAHDLRGPVGAVAQSLEGLASRGGNASGASGAGRMVAAASASASEAYALLENLLSWAVSQRGGIVARPRRMDAAELCDRVRALFEHRAAVKGVALIDDAEAGLEAWGDPDLAQTVLRNLLSNAIKFTPRGGSILVTASGEGDRIRVAVSDSGRGMGREQLERVLAGEGMSEYGTEGERGSGLGIPVARGFAEANGGSFGMDSEEGAGATAWFTLPRYRGEGRGSDGRE